MLSGKCMCPCGGGQSCIVDRRELNDWVHEDDLFSKNNLPLRKDCFQQYTNKQLKILNTSNCNSEGNFDFVKNNTYHSKFNNMSVKKIKRFLKKNKILCRE